MIATVLSPDTPLLLPLGLICTLLSVLIVATWRLANFVRDLRDAVGKAWTVRDQEKWALKMERENRSKGYKIFVPDVVRAGPEDEQEA